MRWQNTVDEAATTSLYVPVETAEKLKALSGPTDLPQNRLSKRDGDPLRILIGREACPADPDPGPEMKSVSSEPIPALVVVSTPA